MRISVCISLNAFIITTPASCLVIFDALLSATIGSPHPHMYCVCELLSRLLLNQQSPYSIDHCLRSLSSELSDCVFRQHALHIHWNIFLKIDLHNVVQCSLPHCIYSLRNSHHS